MHRAAFVVRKDFSEVYGDVEAVLYNPLLLAQIHANYSKCSVESSLEGTEKMVNLIKEVTDLIVSSF